MTPVQARRDGLPSVWLPRERRMRQLGFAAARCPREGAGSKEPGFGTVIAGDALLLEPFRQEVDHFQRERLDLPLAGPFRIGKRVDLHIERPVAEGVGALLEQLDDDLLGRREVLPGSHLGELGHERGEVCSVDEARVVANVYPGHVCLLVIALGLPTEDQLPLDAAQRVLMDRKSTRLNSSHMSISYAVF